MASGFGRTVKVQTGEEIEYEQVIVNGIPMPPREVGRRPIYEGEIMLHFAITANN